MIIRSYSFSRKRNRERPFRLVEFSGSRIRLSIAGIRRYDTICSEICDQVRPRPASPWKGVYNATTKPVPCLQLDLRFLEDVSLRYDKASEDCLYLNVWRPAPRRCQNARRGAKLPVIVFVYGGAFQWGDSSLFIYDMEEFVSKSDVIFVTFNYRIGIFGFLTANSEEAPANNGLWDQHLALKWVKRKHRQLWWRPQRRDLQRTKRWRNLGRLPRHVAA
ncbi:hypothetical protein MTO96_021483 [Rhipicephalus appendiculatus]